MRGQRARSRQKIMRSLNTPRSVDELEPLTGLHAFTLYRVVKEMERDGEVYVAGFIDSHDPRGRPKKLYATANAKAIAAGNANPRVRINKR